MLANALADYPAIRDKVVYEACKQAASVSGLNNELTKLALELVVNGSKEPTVASQLDALANELDERYFALLDEDSSTPIDDEPDRFFAMARAAAALHFALSLNIGGEIESVYEALAAHSEPHAAGVALMELVEKLK